MRRSRGGGIESFTFAQNKHIAVAEKSSWSLELKLKILTYKILPCAASYTEAETLVAAEWHGAGRAGKRKEVEECTKDIGFKTIHNLTFWQNSFTNTLN